MDLLEDTVYRRPGDPMWRAHQTAWYSFVDETQALSVTPAQYSILVAVWKFSSTDSERIAHRLLFEKITINDIVERLEDKGLVERRPSTTDKRVRSIYITEAGPGIVEATARYATAVRGVRSLRSPQENEPPCSNSCGDWSTSTA